MTRWVYQDIHNATPPGFRNIIRRWAANNNSSAIDGFSFCEEQNMLGLREHHLQTIRVHLAHRDNFVVMGHLPYFGPIDDIKFLAIVRKPSEFRAESTASLPDNPQTRQLLELHDWRYPLQYEALVRLEQRLNSSEQIVFARSNIRALEYAMGLKFKSAYSSLDLDHDCCNSANQPNHDVIDQRLWQWALQNCFLLTNPPLNPVILTQEH